MARWDFGHHTTLSMAEHVIEPIQEHFPLSVVPIAF
jgi:hypothetical protein